MLFERFKFEDHAIVESEKIQGEELVMDGFKRDEKDTKDIGLVPDKKGDWVKFEQLQDYGIETDVERLKFYLIQDLNRLKSLSDQADTFLEWFGYDTKFGNMLSEYETILVETMAALYHDSEDEDGLSFISEFVYELDFGKNPGTFKVDDVEYIVNSVESFVDFFVAFLGFDFV
jgi:hypothetical protein